MIIRHAKASRPPRRGPTPRRLAAANRALQRERDSLPLLAFELTCDQESAHQRIDRFDEALIAHDHVRRALAAQHWRWGRRALRQQSDHLRTLLIAKWNVSWLPPLAHYFADFVRTELRRHHIDLPD